MAIFNFVRLMMKRMNILSKTLEQGTVISRFCALSDDSKPGYFHSNCQVMKPSALALDTRRAK